MPAAARDRRRRNSVARLISNIKYAPLIAVRGTCHGHDACRARWPASNRPVGRLDPLARRPRLPYHGTIPTKRSRPRHATGRWRVPAAARYMRTAAPGRSALVPRAGDRNLNLTAIRACTAPHPFALSLRPPPPPRTAAAVQRSQLARIRPTVPPPPRGYAPTWKSSCGIPGEPAPPPTRACPHGCVSLHNPARGLIPPPPCCSHAGTCWL